MAEITVSQETFERVIELMEQRGDDDAGETVDWLLSLQRQLPGARFLANL